MNQRTPLCAANADQNTDKIGISTLNKIASSWTNSARLVSVSILIQGFDSSDFCKNSGVCEKERMSQLQSKPHWILHIFIRNHHMSKVETSPQIFTVVKIKNKFLQKSRKGLGVVGFAAYELAMDFLVLEKIYVTVSDTKMFLTINGS